MTYTPLDWLSVLLCAILGSVIVFQALLNAHLGSLSGLNSYSALMSFLVGIPPILIYYIVESACFTKGNYGILPWWSYLGGLLGAFYIFCVILSIQRLGSATTMTTIIATQVATSVIVDDFGMLGVTVRPLGWGRVLGCVMVIIGSVLVGVFGERASSSREPVIPLV